MHLLRWLSLPGRLLGGSFNFGPASNERYFLANRCFLCLFEAKTVDHLLLHRANTFFFTMQRLGFFGVFFSPSLVYLGFFLV